MAGGEGLGVVLGLPDIDVARLALGPPGQVRDHPGRPTNAAELYQVLGQRGWTPKRYERFLAHTWWRMVLAD